MELKEGKMTYNGSELEKLHKLWLASQCQLCVCKDIGCRVCPFGDVRNVLILKYGISDEFFDDESED